VRTTPAIAGNWGNGYGQIAFAPVFDGTLTTCSVQ